MNIEICFFEVARTVTKNYLCKIHQVLDNIIYSAYDKGSTEKGWGNLYDGICLDGS